MSIIVSSGATLSGQAFVDMSIIVQSGGLASDISMDGGVIHNQSGGSVSDVTLVGAAISGAGTIAGMTLTGGSTLADRGAIIGDLSVALGQGRVIALGQKHGVLSNAQLLAGSAAVIDPSFTNVTAGLIEGGSIASGWTANVFGAESVTVAQGATLDLLNGYGVTLGGKGVLYKNFAYGMVTSTGSVEIGQRGSLYRTIVEGSVFASGGWHPAALYSATVQSGGNVLLDDATANSTQIGAGGQVVLRNGAAVGGTMVKAGGELLLGSGAYAGGQVLAGGAVVLDGAVAAGRLRVEAGALAVLQNGATTASLPVARTAHVVSSGVVLLSATGAITTAATLSNSVIGAAMQEFVLSGAQTVDAVASGGILTILAGGIAIDAQVLSGALYNDGGAAVSAWVGSGGALTQQAGTAAALVVDGGGRAVLAGGTFTAPVVAGLLTVSGTGSPGETLASGASVTGQIDLNGGTARATAIGAGGTLAASGGSIAGLTIGGAGYAVLSGGAQASGILVSSGGVLVIDNANAGMIVVRGGGTVESRDGAAGPSTLPTLSGLHLQPGATASLADAALATPFVASGATLVVDAGDIADATIRGTLAIGTAGMSRDTLLLHGGAIDLAYFAYGAGVSATLSGSDTLLIGSGAFVTSVSLRGSYNINEFSVVADGSGGTLIRADDQQPAEAAGRAALSTQYVPLPTQMHPMLIHPA